MFDNEWYCIYRYDLSVILQPGISRSPLNMFEGLTPYLTVAYSSDYKMDIKLKRWTEVTYEHQLQDFRNVIVWSHLIDQSSYTETPKNEPTDSQKLTAAPYKRHLVAALNTHYMEYGRIRLRK